MAKCWIPAQLRSLTLGIQLVRTGLWCVRLLTLTHVVVGFRLHCLFAKSYKRKTKKKSKHIYLKELKISLKCLRVIAWVGNCPLNGKHLFKFLFLSYRVGTKDNLRFASPEKKIKQHLREQRKLSSGFNVLSVCSWRQS